MKFKLLLISLIVLTTSFSLHKHYISLTKIDYVEEQRTLQITMRFFIDDLEKSVQDRFGDALELSTPQEHEKADLYIRRYIHQKFKIEVNEEAVEYTYLGKQFEKDEVYFFMEVVDIENIKSITVQNGMLTETFEEQQNHVKIKIYETEKTLILNRSNDKEMLKLTSDQ